MIHIDTINASKSLDAINASKSLDHSRRKYVSALVKRTSQTHGYEVPKVRYQILIIVFAKQHALSRVATVAI